MAGAAAGELDAGRVVAGRYRVEGVLGRGGMGRVYRAVDEQLGRAVALKVLAVARDGSVPPEEAARRMLREARAAAAFSHPNAVAVFDVGELEGAPFIAMELVRGRSLREAIGDATVGVRERLRWLGDVARALGAAHRAGLVHRDVKPDNVIVGDDGVVKLLDFGIARRLPGPIDPSAATARDGTITVEGTLVGTPAYMAPEQLRGEKVDGRADQFAWAVTAWELLAGCKPWPATNAAELIAAVLSKPAPPLEVAGVPPSVAATIARALSKAAGDRFVTMDALVAALDGAPPAATRAPRSLWLAVAAVALVVVVALVVRTVSRHEHEPAAPERASTTPVAAAPGAAPIRYVCPKDMESACSQDHELAWCDRKGHFLACCNESLVALGHDGMCGCPKGGSTHQGACPPALHDKNEYGQVYLAGAARRAVHRSCGEAADRLGFDLTIDPDGRVWVAVLRGGATSDERLQRCVLEALQKLEVDPPPDGSYSVNYGPVYLKETVH